MIEDDSEKAKVNFTDLPLMFNLVNSRGDIIRPGSIINFDVKYIKYSHDNNLQKRNEEIFELPFEKCNFNHFNQTLNLISSNLNLDDFNCINTNFLNLTLTGGHFQQDFSYLKINFKKCKNFTMGVSQELDFIHEKLDEAFVNLGFASYNINHYNSTKTAQMKIKMMSFSVTSNFVKNYRILLKEIVYSTDVGFIFEDKKLENFHSYINSELDLNFNTQISNPNFASFSFICSDDVTYYYRCYLKPATVLAYLGGIFNILMTFSQFLCNLLNFRLYDHEEEG